MSEENPRKAKHPDPKRKKSERVEIPLNASRANAVGEDETYNALRVDNRVVMRNSIALNLDSFNAATEEFAPRPGRAYAALKTVRPPFFSVVIPNYNGRRHLSTLFDALKSQTLGDFEVIFADDASSDDSVSFVEQNYAHHLDLRVMVNRQNLGFVASVNAAADAARGRILVLLNSDTEPEPTWLAELAKAVCAHPDAAIIASKLLLFDKRDSLHTAGDLLGKDGLPRNRGVWEKDRGQYDAAIDIFSGCGGAVAIRRHVWQALGGFDEEFWMYLEDVDFAFRAQLSGWQAILAPGARVYHKVSGSGGDDLSSYYVGRNTIWMLVKNMPTALLLRYLPQILGAQVNIARDALRHLSGYAARQRLRGQLAGLAGIPAQWRKRRLIQQRRWRQDAEIEQRLT
ncbi:MAG: glycosyltransferase family 2 protein [Caldilineaceae bacterium]|nr:glycosyltransferase family 2 protein [Caldilineaceae bacterium]